MNTGNAFLQNTYYAMFLEYGDLIPETIRLTAEDAEKVGCEIFNHKPEDLYKNGLCLGEFNCMIDLSSEPKWIKGFKK